MLQDDDVEEEEHHEEDIEEEEKIVHQNKTVTVTKTIRVSRLRISKTTTIHNTVDRNLLIAFTTPGKMERQLDELMLYPYPFTAMSATGIWWEDIMQCVKVQYTDQTKLFDSLIFLTKVRPINQLSSLYVAAIHSMITNDWILPAIAHCS